MKKLKKITLASKPTYQGYSYADLLNDKVIPMYDKQNIRLLRMLTDRRSLLVKH